MSQTSEANRRIGESQPAVRPARSRLTVAGWRPSPSRTALVSYLLLSALLFAAAWRDPFNVAVGNSTDSLLGQWFLQWMPFALRHGHNPLLTNYLDYPAGVNLMWNASMPIVTFVLAPLTTTLGPIFTYNLLTTLAIAFSAWSAFLLIARYVGSPWAAAAGGLVYGFSPFMIAHLLGHPALFIAFIPPLIFLLLDDAVIRQRRSVVRTGILLGLLGTAQLLIGEELLALTALVAALAIVLLIALEPGAVRSHLPHAARTFGVALAVFLVTSAIPLGMEFFGPQRVHGIIQGPNTFVSDALGFVLPSHLQALAPARATQISDRFTGGLAEAPNAYLGIGLVVLLAFIAVRYWSRASVRLATLLGVVLAILSMGQTVHIAGRVTHIPVFVLALVFPLLQRFVPARLLLFGVVLLWLGLIRLPILENILPVRLMIFVFLLAGVLVAVLVDAILRSTDRWTRLAGGLGLAISLILLVPAWPFPASAAPVPEFFRSGMANRIPDGSVALIAPFSRASVNGLAPLAWQAASGMRFRMPEGYIIIQGGAEAYQGGGPAPNPPPSVTQTVMRAVEEGDDLAAFTDPQWREMRRELSRWKVQTVIVGPMPNQARMASLFTVLLGHDPSYQGGVYVWWDLASGPSAAGS